MQALTYNGSKDVRVETMPDRVVAEPDMIVQVTAAPFCGSDHVDPE